MTTRARIPTNCPRCGLIWTASERRDGHVCARRADPDHARAMRDAAKAATRNGRLKMPPFIPTPGLSAAIKAASDAAEAAARDAAQPKETTP